MKTQERNLALQLEVINKFEKFNSVEVHGKFGNITTRNIGLFTADGARHSGLSKQFVC